MKLEVVLKFLVVVFSGIIFAAGAAGLLGGAWLIVALRGRVDGTMPAEELQAFLNLGELLMAGGALLTMVGFLGCYGAARGRRAVLLLHFVLVLVLFAAELAGVAAAIGFTDRLAARAVGDIKRGYGGDASSGLLLTQFWTVTMDVVGCCGVHNYTDFIGSPGHARLKTFPSQCCEPDVAPADCDSQRAHNASSSVIIGCLPKTRELISENRRLVAIVVMSVMYVEICTMVVSMILYCRLRIKRLVVPDTGVHT